MSNNEQQQQQPPQASLIGGHAEYVKGAAEATVGKALGSQAWQASGEQAKAHAVSDMKAAGEHSTLGGYGRPEEVVGKAVGCGGMVREGGESKKE